MKKTTQKIIGPFVQVSFPDYKIGKVKAKIDTGAYTGALHCTKIRVEISGKDKVLRFSPFDHPEVEISMKEYATRHVRSSNGDEQQRYFISTQIKVDSKTYPIILSLADRSEMKWPVLIGRRFLRQNNFLVDASKLKK